jgi:hypothetical protein
MMFYREQSFCCYADCHYTSGLNASCHNHLVVLPSVILVLDFQAIRCFDECRLASVFVLRFTVLSVIGMSVCH